MRDHNNFKKSPPARLTAQDMIELCLATEQATPTEAVHELKGSQVLNFCRDKLLKDLERESEDDCRLTLVHMMLHDLKLCAED